MNSSNSQYPKLIIATSSSALFNLTESDKIYHEEGLAAYEEHQIKNELEVLEPGYGFNLIKKTLKINTQIMEQNSLDSPVIEVVLLSRNSANTGLRVFKSIERYKLDISRAAFCGGRSPAVYAKPFDCQLFLSANAKDVGEFISKGLGAATIYGDENTAHDSPYLNIAFDGDAVLFSDESERITEKSGVEKFTEHEKKHANKPLKQGPIKPFLTALSHIQKNYLTENKVQKNTTDRLKIRTALVTARSAPAHERVILTLRKWGVHLDECIFLGGQSKGEFLKAFKADIFFDDKWENCHSASESGTPSGHVPRPKVKKITNK